MHCPIHEISFILFCIVPSVLAIAFFFPISELAFINGFLVSLWIYTNLFSLSVRDSINKITLILKSLVIQIQNPFPIKFRIFELSAIGFSIREHIESLSFSISILKLSSIEPSIAEMHNTVAVWNSA